MAESLAFYLAVGLAASLCAHACDATGRRRWLVAAVVLLSLVAGLRAYSVGVDTQSYLGHVEQLLGLSGSSQSVPFAAGYGWLVRGVYAVGGDYTSFLLAQALLTNGLVFARLWDYRRTASLGFMTFTYLCSMYPMTLCLSCQLLAVAISFYASRFLDRGRPLLFCAGLTLAASIHVSALVCVVSLVPYLVPSRTPPRGHVLVRTLLLVALCVAAPFIARALIERYASYNTSARASQVGLMVFAQAGVLVCFLMFFGAWGFGGRGRGRDEGLRDALRLGAPRALPRYALSIALSASSYVISNAGRIAYYFLPFGMAVYGTLVRQTRGTRNGTQCTALLAAWYLAYATYAFVLHDGLGIFPYAFVWTG